MNPLPPHHQRIPFLNPNAARLFDPRGIHTPAQPIFEFRELAPDDRYTQWLREVKREVPSPPDNK